MTKIRRVASRERPFGDAFTALYFGRLRLINIALIPKALSSFAAADKRFHSTGFRAAWGSEKNFSIPADLFWLHYVSSYK
jgi:hypothetical protein